MPGFHQLVPMFMFLSIASVALFSFIAVASWADARRREREAFYRSETLKKIAETRGADSAIEFFREEERAVARRSREGQRLGGLITTAVGVGFMIFMAAMGRKEPAYLVGLIPTLVGVALLVYSYLLAPKQ